MAEVPSPPAPHSSSPRHPPTHRLLYCLLVVLQQECTDGRRRRCGGRVQGRHCTAVVPPEEMAFIRGEQRVEIRPLHLVRGEGG